jgi:hypothetical protein
MHDKAKKSSSNKRKVKMKGKKRAYNTAKYSDLAVIALIKFLLIHANQVTN